MRHPEASFIVVGEFGAGMIRSVQVVFVLNAHRAGVAGPLEHAEEFGPLDGT